MRKVILSLALSSLFSFGTANASLIVTSPTIACGLLNDAGLSTGSWRHLYGGKYGCNSPYKDIGTGFPLPNNLAYYVNGDRNSVTRAKLVLNINKKSQAPSAKSALLKASEILSLKLSGTKLPGAIENAIMAGKPLKRKVKQTVVEVKRSNWPTGMGYEIHVVFK